MTYLKVNTTSLAVNGVPSCHFTSSRNSNVHVLPSGECDQLLAKPGAASSVPASYSTRRS